MKLLRVIPALLVAAGLAWLAWPRGRAATPDELIIVSPHWEGIREEFSWAFEEHWKQKTGRKVRLTWMDLGGTSKCMRFIRSTEPGRTGVDLAFGGGVDNYVRLAEGGYLTPVRVPPELLAHMPASIENYPLRDGKLRWFTACLATFGISFNRVVLAKLGVPEPREWEDLAHPLLYKWVGLGEPRSSGTVHICYELMLQSHGWRKGFALVTRIGGNARAFTEGGGGIPRDVAMGQFAAGGAIDFYALERVIRLGSERMGYTAPKRLPIVNGDPVAVIKGAPSREIAEEFVRFVLSERGQGLWYLKPGAPGGPRKFALGRLPVWKEIYATAGPDLARVNPYEIKGLGGYDFKKTGRRWVLLNELLGATIIDPHEELQAAWKALIDAGLPEKGIAELGAPPCSEAEFMALAGRYRKMKPSERNRQAAKWGKWARAKYARVLKKYGR